MPKKSVSVDGLDDADTRYPHTMSSTMSYDTIMLETKKSALVYTLVSQADCSSMMFEFVSINLHGLMHDWSNAVHSLYLN